MTEFTSERELVGVARSLIGSCAGLSIAEGRIVRASVRAPDAAVVNRVRAQIVSGGDPLGDGFIGLRSPEVRRDAGAVYTPTTIVDSMLAWAGQEIAPARIVDPGAGSGRFLLAAAARFPRAALVGVELDPVAALIVRANLSVRGLATRASVLVDDYRAAKVAPIDGATLFVGNPPYVRHHAIGERWKAWYSSAAAEFGVQASMLAGLHLHFFVRTLQLARKGDVGAFITSAEWLDVNYGSALRQLLATRLGGTALHVLEPDAMPFAGALTTGAITCFRVDRRPTTMRVRTVPAIGDLNGLSAGTAIPWKTLVKASRWSAIVRPAPLPPAGFVELGELCRVSRGQVTGGNSIWIAGERAADLPDSVLKPTVTKARELLDAGEVLAADDRLKRVIDLPVDLDELDAADRRPVTQFLKWAKAQGAADSYVAQHRRAWWSVLLYEPAPIMCTYMARRVPAFVRNICGARHINIAHGIYPRDNLEEDVLAALLTYLRQHVRLSSGRTYAGGLTKFEPRELERIPVPALEMLRHGASATMDDRTAHC